MQVLYRVDRLNRTIGKAIHLFSKIGAMGQLVGVKMEVFDTRVRALIDLPPFAALFAEKIKAKLGQVGTKLLR